ncbi:hypothetical protein NCCP2050_10860 [Planococcus sp. NCCP-2050]|nr:hypothetical protein NCCP2050_10860 [Planococcus sp. NCCP-2050]
MAFFQFSGAYSMPFGSKRWILKNVAGFAFQTFVFFGKVKYAEPSFAPKGITSHDI